MTDTSLVKIQTSPKKSYYLLSKLKDGGKEGFKLKITDGERVWAGECELIKSVWNGKYPLPLKGARCTSVVRAFSNGAMGRRIDPSWGGPIELFLVPASAPRLE